MGQTPFANLDKVEETNTKHHVKLLVVAAMTALFALFALGCASDNAGSTSSSEATEAESSTEAAEEASSEAGEAVSSEAAAETPVETPAVEAPTNPVLRLSTTTSVNDSGLLLYLQPSFEAATGYQLEVTSAGTSAAIKKGETGDADALLVHAKASEEEFIEGGYGVERVPFMYNFFVIVGPADDPAGIAGAASAADAFTAIANSGSTFVSRGDDSGTNKKELQIWEATGIEPEGQDWYVNVGDGMGATLTRAAEMEGYTLTDKGTYLAHEAKEQLALLLGEAEDMKNTYSMIAISPGAWPETNIDGANAFIDWMTSDETKELIANYGVEDYGEALFYLL